MENSSLSLFGEPDQEIAPTVSSARPRLLTVEKLSDELNERQMEAVVSEAQYLLILAGAGSGKTRVITYKIAWLIEGGVSPYRILALTFTNKAAREMRERAESLGSISSGSGLWISTFHSACLRILRRYHEKIGYPKDFNVLDQADQERLLKHVIKRLGLEEKENPVRQIASRISKFKNEMKGAEEAAVELHPIRDENFLNIFAHYQQKLVETRNMDFDDLLGKTVELLRREQSVRLEYNNRFAHIMVDEFQDTNAVQYELVTLLAGKETGITVVGDDDQSIYRWRGADVGNFARFEKGHPDIGVVKLEQNYRSTKNILKAAHKVVSQNSGRKEKELWTQKGGGEKVRLTTTLDEIDEANEIAGTINKLVKIESVRLGDIAVFYRTNAQSRALEDVLRREGYPYQIFGGLKFYARAEIKDLLSYFRAVMNPNDAVIAFRRCVNRPPRGIGDVTVGRLIDSAEENGRTPLAMLDYLDDVAGLNSGAIKKLEAVREIFRQIGALLHDGKTPAEAISSALLITGYRQFLEEDKESKSLGRIENLDELVSAAIDYESSTGDSSMLGFLDQATLVADADEVGNETGAVKLMTVHISKGLEFPVVFVAGLEEKLFPHARSIDDPAMMAEERRLLYVAMTRAKERLYLSNAVSRRIFGVTTPCKPSQFLFDIPEDILEIRKSAGLTSQKSIYTDPNRKSFTPANRAKIFGKKKQVSASKTSDGIGVGDKVSHGRFGTGVVRDVSGQGEKSKVTVYFTRYGEKKLIWKFAKLSKV